MEERDEDRKERTATLRRLFRLHIFLTEIV